jgi:hypothetical protein
MTVLEMTNMDAVLRLNNLADSLDMLYKDILNELHNTEMADVCRELWYEMDKASIKLDRIVMRIQRSR